MSKCPCFEIERGSVENPQIGVPPNRRQRIDASIAWCSHANSPAPKARVGSVGSGIALTCQGDTAACQITPNPHL